MLSIKHHKNTSSKFQGGIMASDYEKTVALMAAFNHNDESARIVDRREAGSEIINGRLRLTGQNTNHGRD